VINTAFDRTCNPSYYGSNDIPTIVSHINTNTFSGDTFVLFQIPITAALAFKPIQIIVTKDPCSSSDLNKLNSGFGVIVDCRNPLIT